MSRILKQVAKWVGASALLFCSFSYSNAQAPVVTNPTFGDDTSVHVPLQFGFPFYGRTFTNSWMHSNGVVSFLDPAVNNTAAGWAYCCEGVNLSGSVSPQFSFMIAPLWTDLYPVGSSSFRTEGTQQYQKYFWNNIAEISNMNNLNTFSLEIRPNGFIGVDYTRINIQNQNTTAGIIGDASLGQKQQFYFGRGIPSGALGNWSVNETLADQCTINPLSSPTCPGYTQAMCSSNPLFSTVCSGYQQAYFNQQCSINTLYNVNCPGYAAAYLSYQCSINPLYSTTCEGYEVAYFNQQCSLNPLYSSSCSGYAEAYFSQQCSLNGLYDRQCPNYNEAYAAKMALEEKNKPPAPVAVVTENVAAVALVSDPVVNERITKTETSVSPSAVAAVPLVAAPAPAATTAAVAETSSKDSGATVAQAPAASDSKDKPKTARQELAERRQAAARTAAVERGKELAAEMGKSADMEAQIAVQNVVIAAMGFTPGFDAYGKATIPDAAGYRPFTVYNNQTNVDNRFLGSLMFGPSDRLHNDLVDSQYNK